MSRLLFWGGLSSVSAPLLCLADATVAGEHSAAAPVVRDGAAPHVAIKPNSFGERFFSCCFSIPFLFLIRVSS